MNQNLIEGILSNNHQSIARAISIIEEDDSNSNDDEILTPKCCGENLYLIDGDGNVTNEGDK